MILVPIVDTFRLKIRGIFGATLTAIVIVFSMAVWPAYAAEIIDSETADNEIDTYEKLKVFSEILALLEASYVQEVKSDDLVNGAIRGMLKTLDPHTTYLPPQILPANEGGYFRQVWRFGDRD